MSPRPRNAANRGLPRGWRFRYGAYRFMPNASEREAWGGRREIRLGATLAEAYATWATELARIDGPAPVIDTVAKLAERWLLEHASALKPKTQESYRLSLQRVVAAFGAMAVTDIEPHHVRAYFDRVRTARSLSVARADLTVVRSLLSRAVDWGLLRTYPLAGMRFDQLKAATADVTDDQVAALLAPVHGASRGARLIQAYVRLKLMLGVRRGDMLRIRLSDLHDDGIHVTPGKTENTTGLRLIFPWLGPDGEPNAELREVVNEILAIPPRRIGDAFLFTNGRGEGYQDEATGRANVFGNLWKAHVARAIAAGLLEGRVREKDLRARVAGESATDEEARDRLGHADVAVTRRHYRNRRPRVVQPMRSATGEPR